jgi:hypothetical protein
MPDDSRRTEKRVLKRRFIIVLARVRSVAVAARGKNFLLIHATEGDPMFFALADKAVAGR